MPRLETRAAFARLAGVSAMAITKACQEGKALSGACVGSRVDIDHPDAAAYLAAKRGAIAAIASSSDASPPAGAKRSVPPPARPTRPRPAAAPKGEPERPKPGELGSNEDLEALGAMLQPILDRFGTATACKDWLAALKTIEEIRGKRLDNDETERRLVERELVETHLFGFIDATHRRLLGDIPKTLARRLYAAAKSDTPVEEAEKLGREILGSQLRPLKTTAARVLRDG